MRRLWPAAVLLHLLAGCTAAPALQADLPPFLRPELQTELQPEPRPALRSELEAALRAAGLSGSAGVTERPATRAPGRTDTESDAVSGAPGRTGAVNGAVSEAPGRTGTVSDAVSGAPGRTVAVREQPELTSAAAGGQLCPPQCACFDLTVDCSGRDLRRLPSALPNWTHVL